MGERRDLDALIKELSPGVLTVRQDGPVGKSVMWSRETTVHRDVLDGLPDHERDRNRALLHAYGLLNNDPPSREDRLHEHIEAGRWLAVSTLEKLGLPTSPGRYILQDGRYIPYVKPEPPDTDGVRCYETLAEWEENRDAWRKDVASAGDQDWEDILNSQEGGKASVAWICKTLLDAAGEYRTALIRVKHYFDIGRPDLELTYDDLIKAHSFDWAFRRLEYAVNASPHVWRGRKALESAQAGGESRGQKRQADLERAIADFRAAKKNNPKITRTGWSRNHAHDYGYEPNSLRQKLPRA